MTSARPVTSRSWAWPNFLPETAEHWFTQAGWTSQDWNCLYGTVSQGRNAIGQTQLRAWMRNPPTMYPYGVSPSTVLDALAMFGEQCPEALNAYAGGATPRFVATFLTHHPNGSPEEAWQALYEDLGLTEPEAIGWACTFLLYTREGWPLTRAVIEPEIAAWTDRFGPTAYLHVLAGFDLAEATALQDAGTTVSEQQLRVMVALTGVVLPAGV